MTKILGLDLGTNSIGWAVVEDTKKQILGTGVRIFPEGVNRDTKGGEVSKNETRRTARGARRQQYRRKMRKRMLLIEMAKYGMCPITNAEIKQWKKDKIFPDSHDLREWFKENPYDLRKRALDKPVSLLELGRIFYHMAQRRGFKSNRKQAGNEDGKVKGAISTLQKEITDSNHRTLGEHFANRNPHEQRIRNNYTDRKMYIDEFNAIWNEQTKYHKELTVDLKNRIGISDDEKELGILFFYRPLRSQKYLIGKCTFEPKKPKCPISTIPFEEYRAYQYAHSIEVNGRKLTKEERQKVVGKLMSVEKTTFKVIRNTLKIKDASYNYSGDDNVVGCYTISKLSKLFGTKWDEFTYQEREDVWHTIFSSTDPDWLANYAKKKWGFDINQLKTLAGIHFKQDYASLSRKAINNILHFLKDYPYHVAVVFGGIKNAFGTDWDKLSEEQIDFLHSNVPEIVGSGMKGGFMDDLKKILKDEFGLTHKQLEKLYHHSAEVTKQEVREKLPIGSKEADREINNLRNPIVIQTMFELRKLLNALVDEYGKFDTIKVEMARDLKNPLKRREEIRFDNKRNEEKRDKVKQELDKLGQSHTHDNVLIYQLWEECQRQCPYTGKQIGVEQLFSGEIQIEHIVPWSKSLDDSYMNKTLCYADENRKKGDRTPYQFYILEGEAKWNEVKERALKLFHTSKDYPKRYQKFKRFASEKEPELDSFISRQLNDTRYISKEAKNILSKVCKDVRVAPGQMTAHLRHHWGLNKIINTEDDTKTRADHRHHAIDALVMACYKRNHLNQISKWNRYEKDIRQESIDRPWDGFWEDAKNAVEKVLVAHKGSHRTITTRNYKSKKNGEVHINKGVSARGQLHKEFVYGKRTAPNGKEAFHIRKPLESLTTKTHVEKIVDERIKTIIEDRIGQLGGYEGGKNIPKETFFQADADGHKQPQIFLPNKNGEPIPVRKVRIRETILGAAQLHDNINQFVNPRKNHHILIYSDDADNLKEDVISFWTAVERKKQGQPLFQLPQPEKGKPTPKKIETTFQINDTYLLRLKEDEIDWSNPQLLSNNLYKVQKLGGNDSYFEICFKHHLDSRPDKEAKKDYILIRSFKDGKLGWQTYTPIKVRVTRTGKIERVGKGY